MTNSIDKPSGTDAAVGGHDGPVVGRTKYDFYASLKWYGLAVAVLAFVVVILWLAWSSGVSGVDMSGVADAVSEYWPVLLAFFFGIYLFHHIYWRWIVRGVVLLKESSPMKSYIVSKEFFDLIPDSKTAANPSFTSKGLPLYRCKEIDILQKRVVFGRQHIDKMSMGEVLTFPDRYDQMLKDYHESENDRYWMKDRLDILSVRGARELTETLLDRIKKIAKGEDPFSEDEKKAEVQESLPKNDVFKHEEVPVDGSS